MRRRRPAPIGIRYSRHFICRTEAMLVSIPPSAWSITFAISLITTSVLNWGYWRTIYSGIPVRRLTSEGSGHDLDIAVTRTEHGDLVRTEAHGSHRSASLPASPPGRRRQRRQVSYPRREGSESPALLLSDAAARRSYRALSGICRASFLRETGTYADPPRVETKIDRMRHSSAGIYPTNNLASLKSKAYA